MRTSPTRGYRPCMPWSESFAAVYEPSLAVGEWAGMRRRRRSLVARSKGRTLEIGSGTGLNLPHYPNDLDALTLAEPDPAMRRRLTARAADSGREVSVIDAGAVRLPFDDGSIDTVVSTLVLCTVDEPERALKEIARVLAPGGQLLFIEHVRSDSTLLAAWQDRLERPWRRFAVGCRCNRATAGLLARCGYELDARRERWSMMPPIVVPLIAGSARLGTRGA